MSFNADSVLATQTAALVRDYLLYSRHSPREEVAAAAGVGVATLTRWERRLPRQLPGEIRKRLTAAVRGFEDAARNGDEHAAATSASREPAPSPDFPGTRPQGSSETNGHPPEMTFQQAVDHLLALGFASSEIGEACDAAADDAPGGGPGRAPWRAGLARLLSERARTLLELARDLDPTAAYLGEGDGDGAQAEILERLAQAAEERDGVTGRHTRRVGDMAARIAERIGLGPEEVERIRRAALLHDVGKIGVPDHILTKPGPLTAEEIARMRTHTLIGARLLARGRSPLIATAAEIAEFHHEHWDGSGYPHGLTGEEIPLSARIVAIADQYDALSSDRPYRRALPPEEVLRTIESESGRALDPRLVREFLSLTERQSALTHPVANP